MSDQDLPGMWETADLIGGATDADAPSTPPLAVGDRIWFADERLPYVVQAVSPDGRWVAATKPFAARRTVLYTVLDTFNGLRGRDNYFGPGYESRKACEDAIAMFATGEAEHSRRHRPIEYTIVKHERKEAS